MNKGLVKAIGISNYTITKTENLLKTAKIVPAVNQVECHPYLQQQRLKEYCDSKGTALRRTSHAYIKACNIGAYNVVFLIPDISTASTKPLASCTVHVGCIKTIALKTKTT